MRRVRAGSREANILFLDTECKPGHWIGGDYVSKLLTAVAWSWNDEEFIAEMDHYENSRAEMVAVLATQIRKADIVVGHYERGFDLGLINGTLERSGLPSLPPVMTLDTKEDRLKTLGLSQSQKNLSAMYGIDAPKVDVTLDQWEGFNELRPGYREFAVDRVIGDVRQLRQLYHAEKDFLGAPKLWSPVRGGSGSYRP